VFTTLLAVTMAYAEAASNEEPVHLRLRSGVDVERCEISYMISGSFGGYLRHDRVERPVVSYAIDVVHDGGVARRLKAFVACHGFRVQTFAFDALPPPNARNLSVSLTRLPTVLLVGRLKGWEQREVESKVDIQFHLSGFVTSSDLRIACMRRGRSRVSASTWTAGSRQTFPT
jgi:hypothetical protein